ncbi:MAG TPA: IclR family transcriptional regulator [Devosiaceae bacterium]|jgi:IclR family acetate operon transcriptional repressor
MAKRGAEKIETEVGARSDHVQSVERALNLLEALSDDEEGFRLTDLARITGLSPSTAHRLLTTLEHRNFVQFDHTMSVWHIGRQAFSVGSAFARRRNFVAPALPYLRRLRDVTRETANLGIVDDGGMVVLVQAESREIMRAITRVGGRAPLVASGMGKAILATYSTEDVADVVSRYGMTRLTPKTLTRASDLRAELKTIAQQGYAVDDEETAPGLRCVAAVVFNHMAEPLCAISVSGLSARMTKERVPQLGQLVANTALELTELLGGIVPENHRIKPA